MSAKGGNINKASK